MPAAYKGRLIKQLLCLECHLMCLNSHNFLYWRLKSCFFNSVPAVCASWAMDHFIFIQLLQSVVLLESPWLGFHSAFLKAGWLDVYISIIVHLILNPSALPYLCILLILWFFNTCQRWNGLSSLSVRDTYWAVLWFQYTCTCCRVCDRMMGAHSSVWPKKHSRMQVLRVLWSYEQINRVKKYTYGNLDK